MGSNFKCTIPELTTIWYRCLLCHRCFQFAKLLLQHKKNTECGRLYPILLPHLKLERTVDQCDIQLSKNCNSGKVLKLSDEANDKSSSDVEIQSDCSDTSDTSSNATTNFVESDYSLTTDSSEYYSNSDHSSLSTTTTEVISCRSEDEDTSESSTISENEVIEENNEENDTTGSRKCYFCKIKQSSFNDLLIHMKEHTGEKRLGVNLDPIPRRLSNLRLRPRSSTSEKSVYRDIVGSMCDICGKIYKDVDKLRIHMHNYHD